MIKSAKIIFKDYKPVLSIVSSDYNEVIRITDFASALTTKPPIDNKMRFFSTWVGEREDHVKLEIQGKSIKHTQNHPSPFFHSNPDLDNKFNYLEVLIEALHEKNIIYSYMKQDLIDTIHAYYKNTLFNNDNGSAFRYTR